MTGSTGATAWLARTTELDAHLESSLRAVTAWLDKPGTLLDFRPEPSAWTVREVCEHVALTNRFLLILVEKIATRSRSRSERGDAPPPLPSPIASLTELASRDFRWKHPEHMTPTGTVPLGDVRSELDAQRERARALIQSFPAGEGALHRIRMSVVGGEDDRLDLYQFLEIVVLHADRHVRQMERNSSALGANP
jgi:hypothetical protein